MIWNSIGAALAGVLLFVTLLVSPGFAHDERPLVEKGYSVVEGLDIVNRTLTLRGHDYRLTGATQFLDEVEQPARLADLEVQSRIRGRADADTGTRVYFEANFEHSLLKLHIVEMIPR